MLLLAFESSCDETAVAVVKDGRTVLSSVIASSAGAHMSSPPFLFARSSHKTGRELNGEPAEFSMAWASLQRLSTSARLALCLGVAGLTGGCVDLPKVLGPAPVDPTSAVAQDVLAASKAKGPFPTFRQIPAVPTDVRPVTAWRASVLAMTAEKAALETNVANLSSEKAALESNVADLTSQLNSTTASLESTKTVLSDAHTTLESMLSRKSLAAGYAGDVVVTAIINGDGKIAYLTIDASGETEGLGQKVMDS